MLKYMLDTNICILTIKHKPQEVREVLTATMINCASVR
jgi:predicted nucleic acid-binding protein